LRPTFPKRKRITPTGDADCQRRGHHIAPVSEQPGQIQPDANAHARVVTASSATNANAYAGAIAGGIRRSTVTPNPDTDLIISIASTREPRIAQAETIQLTGHRQFIATVGKAGPGRIGSGIGPRSKTITARRYRGRINPVKAGRLNRRQSRGAASQSGR
jgi:hypothetical protein